MSTPSFHFALPYLFAGLFLLPCADAQSYKPDPGQTSWIVVPGFLKQTDGKYTASHLVLYQKGCGRNSKGELENRVDPTLTYQINVSGDLRTPTSILSGECTLSFDLAAGIAQPGTEIIEVRSADPAKPAVPAISRGFGILTLMDALSQPTPGKPQVDVIWGVLSNGLCSDTFGIRVASKLFCIQARIGNNSAHALQLAGVGFQKKNDEEKTPNTGYLITRAEAQTGASLTGRNIVYHSLQAAGLLLAGGTPFFTDLIVQGRWSTATSFVAGPLLAGFNLVAPDLTVREGNNLDDQAFRDGKLIPNNTQVALMLFLDKKEILSRLQKECTTDPIIGAIGEPAQKKKAQKTCLKGDDPRVAKIAIGDLILIGDEVEYIQRVVVDSTVTSQEIAARPQVITSLLTTDGVGTMLGTSMNAAISVLVDNVAATIVGTSTPEKLQFKLAASAVSSLAAGQIHTVALADASGNILTTQTITVKTAPLVTGVALQTDSTGTVSGSGLDSSISITLDSQQTINGATSASSIAFKTPLSLTLDSSHTVVVSDLTGNQIWNQPVKVTK
ncbi:MAG TPA: hypothetical protein VGD64_03315 [Acidisarcina sp.]